MGIDILDSWQTVANITALFLHQGPNLLKFSCKVAIIITSFKK